MNIQIRIGTIQVREAIEQSDKTFKQTLTKELNAPLNGVDQGMLEEAWSFIKDGLIRVSRKGASAIEDINNSVWSSVESIITSAGDRAEELEEKLHIRLREYSLGLQREVLSGVLPTISVGDATLTLQTIEMVQTSKLEGSLKTTLTDLLSITASGEFQIHASYSRVEV